MLLTGRRTPCHDRRTAINPRATNENGGRTEETASTRTKRYSWKEKQSTEIIVFS